ncbi:DUF4062 domain-containing protein [Mucilaginibacter aquariorum]|uniref:DUF4062 domain-containing protein n=1 Tax=Mucilaginibacter aquariorum TaxID=2967225 RepID=A0ABT1T3L8_9SPHI|nr:DUF4062 domain-containing protein [Mucilaginibacter aquariorum]MCQ6959015.1 DUF4062 domain-containing protein [Mucilaginibacter aquariorum]
MDQSSEYHFPIFISSTDYNLKDLRAELARFLSELGYRPILSSAEGFPDSSPNLEPWESCIPVLEQSFVMVLVIDGRYGTALDWKNSHTCLQEKNISPTHGEYIYAHHSRKRMLVFIRDEVMTYYQSYRTAFKKCGKDFEKTKEVMEQTLPEYIDFETLQFVHQVKTTKPIPWIKEFKDITEIKKEVQKKMLNELAELFLIKNARLETVVSSFDKVMHTLSIDEQRNVLNRIGATKQLIGTVEEIATYEKELQEKTEALSKIEGQNKQDKDKYEKSIIDLKQKIKKLEAKSQESSDDSYYIRNGSVQVNPNYVPPVSGYSGITGSTINVGGTGAYTLYGATPTPRCNKCQMPQMANVGLIYGHSLRKCPKCERMLCNSCWPSNSFALNIAAITSPVLLTDRLESAKPKEEVCPECVRNN